MDYLADRTGLMDASGIRKVFALAAKLKDPVNFSIGQPDFDVPEPVKEAAIEAIRRGRNSYSQTAGDAEVVACLKQKVKADYGWEDSQLMLTDGVSGGLLLAFMALINPGDEVIMSDPYFVIYKHVINILGGKCVYVDTYPDFRLPPEKVAEAVTGRTKLIVLNSPANPTGIVYTSDEIKKIVEIARQKDIIILSDEIYDVFSYDGKSPSPGSFYDKTLILNGFSKTTPFQVSVPAALAYDMSGYVDSYRAKRNHICDGLKDSYEIVTPGGAFYLFVKAPDKYPNATEFVKEAIKNNLLIIPGNVFSEQDSHFRISYATTDEKIEQGVEILNKLA
jgi:aspartate aminotransferase/aminotransferase